MIIAKKLYFHISFLLIITAVMIGLIIIPSIASIQTIGEKIRQQDQKLSEKKSSGFSIEKVKTELAGTQKQADPLAAAFVGNGQELEMITQLEGLAQKSGVNVQVAPDLNPKPASNNVQRLPLKISAIGAYLNILKFISNIETLSHYFNISQLDIKPQNDASGAVTLEIEGQNYIYLEK